MSIIDNFLRKRGFVKREDVESAFIDYDDGVVTKSASFMPDEVAAFPQKRPDSEYIRDYETFINVYRQLPWLYAAGTALCVAARKPELEVLREVRHSDGSTEQQEVVGTELNALVERPNPDLSYTELIQITVLNLFLTGNAYWELVSTSETQPISKTSRPVEIWWIKPQSMTPMPDDKGDVKSYIYTSPQGRERTLDASRVIHFKQPNPGSYFLGLGCIEPLINTATLEFNAVNFNKNFLENDAMPPFVFTHPKDPDKQQRDRFWADWDARHKGPKRTGKPGMIWGGMDVKPLGSASLKDMQYMEMRKMNREEMLASAGVPPSIVGLLEYANYSNMEVQAKKFWDGTVIPLMDLIADKLSLRLAPLYDSRFWFAFDYSRIDVLKEDEERKARIAALLIQNGLKTPNEVLDEMYGDEPYDGGDVHYVGMSLVPVDAQTAPATPGAEPQPVPPAQPSEEMMRLRRLQAEAKRLVEREKAKKCAACAAVKEETPAAAPAAAENEEREDEPSKPASFWTNAERKQSLWLATKKRSDAQARAFAPEVEKYFRRQAMSVKRALEEFASVNGVTADMLFDKTEETKRYVNKFEARYRAAFERAGEAGLHATKGKLWIAPEERHIKDDDEFHVTPEHLQKLKAQMAIAGMHVNSTTWEKIDKILLEATTNNWNIEEASQKVWETLDDYGITRSRLVAETEMARTENFGALEGFKDNSEVELKGWMCSMLPDSREAHIEADGQEVPLDADFSVGGESLEYPGDPRADAGNVCNCRCAMYPVVPNY